MFDIDGVIFDLDGTLIDSIETHLYLVEELCRRLDIPLPSKEVISEFVMAPIENIQMLFPQNIHGVDEAMVAKTTAIMTEIYQTISLQNKGMIAGVDVLFEELNRNHIKIGVVTSTHKKILDQKLQPLITAGIDRLIESIICIEDALQKKPAPDPLIECLKRLNLPAFKSIYVGDSYIDIRAGKAAGMKTVGVLTGLDSHERLSKERPDLIIGSVAELTPMLFIKWDR